MNEQHDVEHRLGQGLKRWAEAGQPSIDLVAFVEENSTVAEVATRRRAGWVRWVSMGAAAAVLLLGLFASFPTWAGAASGWPIVGPVVTEIIMKDAGLKWAYENGLIQGTVAEGTQDGITVRILGVMAGPVRTTFIYQITGLTKPEGDSAKPVRATGPRGLFLDPPTLSSTTPEIKLNKLPGNAPNFMSYNPPTWTAVGLVGTVSTSAIAEETGEIALTITIGGHQFPLSFPASRVAADKLTREVAVGEVRKVGDITITVDSVIQSPVETAVKYRVEKPAFNGSYSWNNHDFSAYVEAGGQKHYSADSHGVGQETLEGFPTANSPARLIFPAQIKGVQASLTWPLQSGATQQFEETTITLESWERDGDRMAFRWRYLPHGRFVSFGDYEVIDADGHAYPFSRGNGSHSNGAPGEALGQQQEGTIPAGVEPVAVRAKQVAVAAPGPWVFDLPQR